jgi:GT2 family glycosyltransferase/peptidoglycan/xylan/chitin deacetylase (PgdA/CDA1 family)
MPVNRMHSSSDKPLISVVIVVWNAKEYIATCLRSLEEVCMDSRLEIIVVDNASSDGAPDLIAREFPGVKLIRNPDNCGFAKANNIGIRESAGDYICLVNSDVKFTSNCFEPMLRYLQDHVDIGLLGPISKTEEGVAARSTMRLPTVWNSFIRAVGLDVPLGRLQILKSQLMTDFDHTTTRDVEVLNGWFWMVSRKALDRVGLLDERFFIYGEDVDWCVRFHEVGMRIVFFAGAEAIHYGGASSAAAPKRFSIEMLRATWQYFCKHHSLMQRVGLFIAGVLNVGIRAAGYGLGSIFTRDRKAEVVQKFQRSTACLIWLLQNSVVLRGGVQESRSVQKQSGQNNPVSMKARARRDFLKNGIALCKRCLKLFVSLGYYCGQRLWRRWQQMKGEKVPGTCVVLYYHSVGPGERANFARQMTALSHFAKPTRADRKGQFENGVHHAAVSFHDAFESVCENALPEMAERGIPSTLFVPSGYVGRHPGWNMEDGHPDCQEVVIGVDRLRSLNTELVSVGSHTVTHPDMMSLSPENAKTELRKSRLDLEAILGRPVELFAFPYGRHNESLVQWCKEAGYQRVFTIQPKLAFSELNEFVTGSCAVSPMDWSLEFKMKLLGAYQWLYQLRKN